MEVSAQMAMDALSYKQFTSNMEFWCFLCYGSVKQVCYRYLRSYGDNVMPLQWAIFVFSINARLTKHTHRSCTSSKLCI